MAALRTVMHARRELEAYNMSSSMLLLLQQAACQAKCVSVTGSELITRNNTKQGGNPGRLQHGTVTTED